MCGRFTLKTELSQIASKFHVEIEDRPSLPARYNVAPSQDVAAVRGNDVARELAMLRWGLIPFWAKDTKVGYKMINARGETAAEKPSFRNAFAKRRCLVLADGFFEWQKRGNTKQPFYIRRQDGDVFAMAGLWESWRDIESCTIITTTANELMQPLHDRMPVILADQDYDIWLDAEFNDKHALQELLKPSDPEAWEAYPVSTLVNNARNDVAACVEPIDPSA